MACDVDRWIARREFQPRPTIAKVCLHCGFIAYFDAAITGVLPPKPEPPEAPNIRMVVDGRIFQSAISAELIGPLRAQAGYLNPNEYAPILRQVESVPQSEPRKP